MLLVPELESIIRGILIDDYNSIVISHLWCRGGTQWKRLVDIYLAIQPY